MRDLAAPPWSPPPESLWGKVAGSLCRVACAEVEDSSSSDLKKIIAAGAFAVLTGSGGYLTGDAKDRMLIEQLQQERIESRADAIACVADRQDMRRAMTGFMSRCVELCGAKVNPPPAASVYPDWLLRRVEARPHTALPH